MTRNISTFLLSCLTIAFAITVSAQTTNELKIDSLLRAYEREKTQIKKGILLLEIGEAHVPNNMDSLVSYSKRACKVSFPKHPTKKEEKQIKEIYGRANNNIGYAYYIQGRNVEALSYYNKALDLFKELNDIDGISKLYNNIGGIYKFAGNFKEAEKLYLEGLDLLKGSKDSLSISIFENNLGLIYKNLGEYNRAIEHFVISERIRRKLKDKNGLAATLNNMGVLYQKMNRLDSAANCFYESMAIVEETNNIVGKSHVCINIGEVEFARGNTNEALRFGLIAINAAKEVNSFSSILDASRFLSEVYEQKRDYKNAFEMQKIFIEYSEKVNQEELNRELIKSEVESEYEIKAALAKKENEKINALAEKQKEIQQSVIFASIIVLVLVILFIVVLYKRLKSTSEQSKIIEKQNNDRKVLLQEIHHRVKNNFQIISSLLKLQTYSEDNPSVEKAFDSAISRIHAMSVVHEIIYKQDTFAHLSTKNYLDSLIENLKNTFDHERVELHVQSVESTLSIEQFIPIGIIINELITNSFKHAFPDIAKQAHISIDLDKVGQHFSLTYKDNGIGFIRSKLTESFGMGLIDTMVDQLSGKMEISSTPEWGTIFTIQFEQNN